MKKGIYAVVIASAVLGASSMAFAGAYGEPEQPEELPAPVPAAPAPEPEPVVRAKHRWAGFFTDAETTRGLWIEAGSSYAAKYHSNAVGDVEAVPTYLFASYGTEDFEVGVKLPPFVYVDNEGIDDDKDFGDMNLWGKYMFLRQDNFTGGVGMVMTFPTGASGFGTSEYGFMPFLTFGYTAGPVDIRLSGGYDVYTEHDSLGDVYDKSDLNLTVIGEVAENLVARAEMVHNHFTESDADPVSIFPGLDYYIPVGDNELVLRPTLGIGITEAPDWQIGLGIAFNVLGI